MKKRFVKQILTMLLAFAMVFTMIPLLGVGVQEAYAATASGGTVKSNSTDEAKSAFGSSNVTASYGSKTLTITLSKDIALNAPVKFTKGNEGDKVVLNLNGHTITGKDGTSSTTKAAATGKTAIEIEPANYNIEIKGPGTVIGGNGVKYTFDQRRIGGPGGMAVAFTDSNWRPTANNGTLTYGLTVSNGAALKGGSGADMTGDDWMYNIENYNGNKKGSPLFYENPMFQLTGGRGGDAIGQTGAEVPYGVSDTAYAAITISNGTVAGGSGGKINLNTSSMPLLTHYGLMHNDKIRSFMDNYVVLKDKYSGYVANQIKFLPGNGGDGIVIGDGRKYVYVAKSGTVEGGTSGNFDYGQSNLVNQYDSIGGGRVATAGNGISVYGDVGLTSISPTDSSVTSGNAASKTKDSNEMGIYIAGKVKGGSSPDAKARNEYSGDAGHGIALDGLYGRYDWGVIEVGSGGSATGGTSGKAADGSAGTGGDGIRELTEKGDGATDTKYGSDYHIVNGTVKGGNGGDNLGLSSAGAGGSGMAFGNYRKNVRIFGSGTVYGGDYGSEFNHGQASRTDRTDAIHMWSKSDNVVSVNQVKGKAATINNVEKLNISASVSNEGTTPTTVTKLTVTGIPQGYSGDVFIKWSATIYETSSVGSGTYDLETTDTNLRSINLLSNSSYGIYDSENKLGYLAYPMYPGYSSIQLNMNHYTAPVATTDRMTEDGKYQTDITCKVLLADGRWGKSDILRYEKNKGWSEVAASPEDEGGQSGEDQEEMERVLAIGAAIEALPLPANVKVENNTAIVSAYDDYHSLLNYEPELIQKYLFDFDYGAKVDACYAALTDIAENGGLASDEVLLTNIANRLSSLPENVADYTLANSEEDVRAAQAAYNNLRNKAQLSTELKEKLDAAVVKVDALRQEADSQACRHVTLEHVAAKAATCHNTGNIEHYKCVGCDKLFSDPDGETEITAESIITPVDNNNHEYGEWVVEKPARCNETGIQKRTCKHHNEAWEKEDIPADPEKHNWGTWSDTQTASCALTGEKERTCSVCGKKETQVIAKTEHTWSDWEPKETATCEREGSKERECTTCHTKEMSTIPTLEHEWDEGEVTTNPSCDREGVRTFKCKNCDAEKTEPVAKIAHSYSSWVSLAPTEESQGIMTYRCDRCGHSFATAIAPITLPTDLPGVKVSKPAKGKKAITVKWKKVKKKNQKKIGGIEIQVAGPSGTITTTAGKKKSSKKVKGLLPKQTYRCRVRAYNYIGGVKHVSAWSGWKSAKTK